MTATVHTGLHHTVCRSCGASCMWATTRGDKPMLVNVRPVATGNVLLDEQRGADGGLILRAEVLSKGQAAGARAAGRRLHTSHFVDCPQADQWRTKRRTARR